MFTFFGKKCHTIWCNFWQFWLFRHLWSDFDNVFFVEKPNRWTFLCGLVVFGLWWLLQVISSDFIAWKFKTARNCTRLMNTFFSKPFEKCEHSAKISISCNFFVSRWILLKSGLRGSTRFLFRFLFLVFRCYHAIANLLQTLHSRNQPR